SLAGVDLGQGAGGVLRAPASRLPAARHDVEGRGMNGLRVRSVGAGDIWMSGLEPVMAAVLLEVPAILGNRDQPEARRRLLPDPQPGDPLASAEWHRLMDGELLHLFASAGEVFERDLSGLRPDRGEITFPAKHIPSWMSAINQARLILGELHHVDDAVRTPESVDDDE